MLVLLCSWLTFADLWKTYDLVEAFAGGADVTRGFRTCRVRAAACDLQYDASCVRRGGMDLSTAPGFVYLASNQCDMCRQGFVSLRTASTSEADGSSFTSATP